MKRPEEAAAQERLTRSRSLASQVALGVTFTGAPMPTWRATGADKETAGLEIIAVRLTSERTDQHLVTFLQLADHLSQIARGQALGHRHRARLPVFDHQYEGAL